jgi:hypothetical protein
MSLKTGTPMIYGGRVAADGASGMGLVTDKGGDGHERAITGFGLELRQGLALRTNHGWKNQLQ